MLPFAFSGETGCGKSSLVTQLCNILRVQLFTFNIHGGIEDADIITWMDSSVRAAKAKPAQRFVVFLDEVNTTNSMALFKEIICDRSMNGVPLPPNIDIIAACNPYRLKKGLASTEASSSGLLFNPHEASQENIGSGIRDPLKDLVYRVHPLPESMVDLVFDFGALTSDTEFLYISSMLRASVGGDNVEMPDAAAAPPAAGGAAAAGAAAVAAPPVANAADDDGFDKDVTRRIIDALIRSNEVGKEMWNQKHLEFTALRAPLVAANGAAGNAERELQLKKRLSGELLAQLCGFGEAFAQPDVVALNNLSRRLQPPQVGKECHNGRSAFITVFSTLINASQEFVRNLHGGERASCSLRDVARCLKIFEWFGKSYRGVAAAAAAAGGAGAGAEPADEEFTQEDFFAIRPNALAAVRRAVIMSLSFCYLSRLPFEHRILFRQHISQTWKNMQTPLPSGRAVSSLSIRDWFAFDLPSFGPMCLWLQLSNPDMIEAVITDVQKNFVSHMKLPECIALNDALLENVFVIMVSILNKLPVFIIGKPGSSKSLAMQVIQSSLRGKASDSPYLRTLPAVEVISYQCSPLSTSAGIQAAFKTARSYETAGSNSISVVLLDEVGLAEQSPHLPLKVLHKVLDENNGGAVVGISNWALDPAKMNRAAHLFRPAPIASDLARTAEGIVGNDVEAKGYLHSLAHAYFEVYGKQAEWKQEDFWGLRDFYSTVKSIYHQKRQSKSDRLDHRIILNAVQRNFGGQPAVFDEVLAIFYRHLKIVHASTSLSTIAELVEQNVYDKDARHLMLLTTNNTALGLLFEMKRVSQAAKLRMSDGNHDEEDADVDSEDDDGDRLAEGESMISHSKSQVIFGSDFPLDKSDLQISLNLQKIKTCMSNGTHVVLVHCEALYESLYDLLNQHYISVKSTRFVRIAFGMHSGLFQVHANFRIICIVDKADAYRHMAPPFLNRFEKQVLERHHMLALPHTRLAARLKRFAEAMLPLSDASMRGAFCGFHADSFASLAQTVIGTVSVVGEHNVSEEQESAWFAQAVQYLLWITVPEVVCRAAVSASRLDSIAQEFHVDVRDEYLEQQSHSDLGACMRQVILPQVLWGGV